MFSWTAADFLMNEIAPSANRRWPDYILLVFMLALLAVLFLAIRKNSSKPLPDYLQYWAAGHLILEGRDPYDGKALLTIQRSAGWQEPQQLMMWYPPWALQIMMPMALVDYATGRTLWWFLQIWVLVYCANSLWNYFGGPPEKRWLAWLGAFMFTPTLALMLWGQLTFLVLLGCTWFLMLIEPTANRSNIRLKGPLRDLLAGASTVLISLKPHIFYLFWPVLMAWTLQRKRWWVICGAVLGLALGNLPCLFINPGVITHYISTMRMVDLPPSECATPTLGFWLRVVFGVDRFWLQFMPALGGVAWLIFNYGSKRDRWSWAAEIPWLLLVSMSTGIYFWTHDQVILIPAILQIIAGLSSAGRSWAVLALTASWILITCLSFILHFQWSNQYFVWLAPLMLILYAFGLRMMRRGTC